MKRAQGRPAIIRRILTVFFVALASFVFFTARWGLSFFQVQSFSEIVFHMKVSLEGVNSDVWRDWFDTCAGPTLVMTVLICVVLICSRYVLSALHLRRIAWVSPTLALVVAIMLMISAVVHASLQYGADEYIRNQVTVTGFYEQNYVNPAKTSMEFPATKRNLVFIYVESLETTYGTSTYVDGTTVRGGGFQEQNFIPQISQLAAENVNFSNTGGLGGALQVASTGWTIAGMVAQSAGLPLNVSVDGNSYGQDTPFLPGAYAIGEVLEAEGYYQELLVGSDATFGGRSNFFQQHGDYRLFDVVSAQAEGRLPEGYNVWWGFEDEKLFQFAREEIAEAAQGSAPFNVTLLTADTHHPDGFVSENNPFTGNTQYQDVIRYSDQQVAEFVAWIQEQPFYEDTTIVISGDHLSMNTSYLNIVDADPDYVRTTLNVFINPAEQPVNPKNRLFSTMDLYPTTLAALGVRIDGERLGLGTNLFSDRPTLIEDVGFEAFDDEIAKRSEFYNTRILGD